MPPGLLHRLLGQIVDLIDSLMEEWFPGLLDTTPHGEWLVQCRVPCIHCPANDPYMFYFDELLNQAKMSDEIECPNHPEPVHLLLLAPDVMLGDLERKYMLDETKLQLSER